MTTPDEVRRDLPIFFGDAAPEAVEQNEQEKQALDLLAEAFEKDAKLQGRTLCAYLKYDGSCGFAKSGSVVFAVNRLKNRRVRATIEVRWRQGVNHGARERVVEIPAGGKVRLGCTRSEYTPVTDYTYEVVGCEQL